MFEGHYAVKKCNPNVDEITKKHTHTFWKKKNKTQILDGVTFLGKGISIDDVKYFFLNEKAHKMPNVDITLFKKSVSFF